MFFAPVAHLVGNLVVVSGVSTGRVSGKLVKMLIVRVKMNQVLRSVRLKTKRLYGNIWTREALATVLAEKAGVAVGVEVAVVTLVRTPPCQRNSVPHF